MPYYIKISTNLRRQGTDRCTTDTDRHWIFRWVAKIPMLMAYWLQWPDLFGIPEMPVDVMRSICFLITLCEPNRLEDVKIWFSQIFIHGSYKYHLGNGCWWLRPSLSGIVQTPRMFCAYTCHPQSGGNCVKKVGKNGWYFEDDFKYIFLISINEG